MPKEIADLIELRELQRKEKELEGEIKSCKTAIREGEKFLRSTEKPDLLTKDQHLALIEAAQWSNRDLWEKQCELNKLRFEISVKKNQIVGVTKRSVLD